MSPKDYIPSNYRSNAIKECSGNELHTNYLASIFQNQTKAIVLSDSRIPQFFEQILGCIDSVQRERGMPFFVNNSFFSLAQNFQRNSVLGDRIRFIPGSFAQMSRKMRIFPSAGNKEMQVDPPYFIEGNNRFYYPQDLLQGIWELMTEILNSIIPLKEIPFAYSVQVEIIKYPDSKLELDNLQEFLSLSAGCWTKLGMKLDSIKRQSRSILRTKGINDLLAFASLLSPIKPFIHRLNLQFDKENYKQIPEKGLVINRAHQDADKIVTCLASERDVIHTQIYDGNNWVELPLTSNTLAIFPSTAIPDSISLKPTVHRVIFVPSDEAKPGDTPKLNATVTFAIVKKP